jgi:hypothetical protein
MGQLYDFINKSVIGPRPAGAAPKPLPGLGNGANMTVA